LGVSWWQSSGGGATGDTAVIRHVCTVPPYRMARSAFRYETNKYIYTKLNAAILGTVRLVMCLFVVFKNVRNKLNLPQFYVGVERESAF